MKQDLAIPTDTPEAVKNFIMIWKSRKYDDIPSLTIGQLLELLLATSNSFHTNYSDGRFFNNILVQNEAIVAWDGDELIDTLWYEVVENIQTILVRSRTFNENVY